MFRALTSGVVALSLAVGCRCEDDALPRATSEPSTTPPPEASSAAFGKHVERNSSELSFRVNASSIALGIAHARPCQVDFTGSGICPYRVHALRDKTLVTRCQDVFVLASGRLVPQTDDAEAFGRMPVMGGALESGPVHMNVDELEGRWPDGAWARVSGTWTVDGARLHGELSGVFQFTGGSWIRRATNATGPYVAVSAWSGGKNLAFGEKGYAISDGTKAGPLPEPAAGADRKECPRRVLVDDLVALASGEVFAVGRDCQDRSKLLVEHWASGQTRGKIEDLGSVKPGPAFIAADAKRVYVWTSSMLARRDEQQFRRVPLPTATPLAAGSITSDGSLWLVFGDGAARLEPDGTWTRATLPTKAAIERAIEGEPEQRSWHGIAAPDPKSPVAGATYACSDGRSAAILLGSTSARVSVPDADDGTTTDAEPTGGDDADASATNGEEQPPTSLTSGCKTPFVVLYAVAKTAPENFDYPATRDALSGSPLADSVSFVEYTYRERRTLGAKVSSRQEGERLVALISEKVKGSKPTLVCFEPKSIRRTLGMKR